MAYSTEVKYFHSSMIGSPVVSGSQGSLVAMLDACLVNGFGLKTVDTLVVAGGVATANISTGHSAIQYCVVEISGATPAGLNGQKRATVVGTNTVSFDATGISDQTATGTITLKIAGAGWEKAFAGTNKAVYRSPDIAGPRHYFRFDDTGTYACKVRGFETLTDIDTGTGLFPDATSAVNGTFFVRSGLAHPSTTAKDWFVIANDKFVFVGNRGYQPGTTYPFVVAGFGQFKSRKSGDAYRSLVRGNVASDNAGSTGELENIAYSSTGAASYSTVARDYTGLGGNIAPIISTLIRFSGSSFASGNGSVPYPNPADYGLLLSKMTIQDNGTYVLRGELPGVLASPQSLLNRFCPNASTPVFVTDVPDLPGRILVAIPSAYSSTSYGITFFDITGPWGN